MGPHRLSNWAGTAGPPASQHAISHVPASAVITSVCYYAGASGPYSIALVAARLLLLAASVAARWDQ